MGNCKHKPGGGGESEAIEFEPEVLLQEQQHFVLLLLVLLVLHGVPPANEKEGAYGYGFQLPSSRAGGPSPLLVAGT